MDDSTFRRLLETYLVPMFPGARLAGPQKLSGTYKQKAVAFTSPGEISVRPSKSATFDFVLSRSQVFAPSELKLVEQFVVTVEEIASALGRPYEVEVTRSLPVRVVARGTGGHPITVDVLEQMNAWAMNLYEGKPIVAAIGIDPAAKPTALQIGDLWREPFAPVLTNGADTVLICTPTGAVSSLQALDLKTTPSFAPFRFRALAEWATGARIASALTRTGEILVFQETQLRFARRSGVWHHFTHEPVLSSIHLPWRKPIKTTIYETCLDVSFAKTGGCLAVVSNDNLSKVNSLVDTGDLVNAASTTKTKLVVGCVGKTFAQLDRRVRQELLAVDGAMVLDHQGTILAVGAIVKVATGSTGGGRLAAAKRLGNLGMGIKISQDGGVTAFGPAKKELFRIG